MEQVYDCIVIGGGPAGLSAAVNLRRRGRAPLVFSGGESLLAKAELVDNYLGLPGLTGRGLMDAFAAHARQQGVEVKNARVGNVMPFGGTFMVNAGGDILTARTVILACGVSKAAPVEGESEFLGRGVSYCATCDGMLYRGKRVVVWGLAPDAPEEANFLAGIGCKVTYLATKRPEGLAPDVVFTPGRVVRAEGEDALRAVVTPDGRLDAEGLFILRAAAPPDSLVPGLAVEGGAVVVNSRMETNIPGLYAAGDLVGTPYQVSKAAGEGLVAALAADSYLAAHTA